MRHTALNILQDQGQCLSSKDASSSYGIYGRNTTCALNGKGGPLINNVYKFIDPGKRGFGRAA